MALFTDGTITTQEDLIAHESRILDLASTEGIDLAAKLDLAQEEIGVSLSASSPWLSGYGAEGISLRNVAVTAPLKLWHAFRSLELVYRDAYGNQFNERYERKAKQYRELSRWASETLFQIGVGLVWNPLPSPGIPELGFVAGPQDAATYFVRTSWTNSSGEESAAGQLAEASIPNGSLLTAKTAQAPANATGWNVYVGTTVEGLSLQNQGPLGLGATWTEAGSGLVAGRAPGQGQEPSCLRGLPRVLERG